MATTVTAPKDLAGKLAVVGLATPVSRALCGGAVATLVLMALRPKALFRENGEYRPFKLSSPDPDGIYLHAGVVPLIAGWTVATFL